MGQGGSERIHTLGSGFRSLDGSGSLELKVSDVRKVLEVFPQQ